MTRLAVVVPVYGNEESLPELYRRIVAACEEAKVELTLQFVNDRSPDGSQEVLEALAREDPRVRVLLLAHNHGSFTAIRAGMEEVRDHDAAVLMAADLQDPPETIPALVAAWREGPAVILGVRERREDPAIARFFSQLWHRFYRRFVMPGFPEGGFDFCLLDRRVVEVVGQASERNTSLVGLIVWAGFEQARVTYVRAERPHGSSMWTLFKKLNYAIDSVVSFSSMPLRAFSLLGVTLSLAFVCFSLFTLFNRVTGRIHPEAHGWTSLMLTLLFVGSVTFLGLGVLGEYLLNNLSHARGRPLFVVDRRVGGAVQSAAGGGPVPFFSLARAHGPVVAAIGETASRIVTRSTQIVLGPEVERFERELGAFLNAEHVVGVANGTDALTLALWAAGLTPGDEVLVPALTAPPTAVAVLRAGGVPVFVDVEPEHLTLSPAAVRKVLEDRSVKFAIPVHLYGNPCDMEVLSWIAEEEGLTLIEDCAQSLGSQTLGRHVGTGRGSPSAFSFYPTKNLGAYGDAGAVVLADAEQAERVRRMRSYGQNEQGECVDRGFNSRLDELQAALLSERLKVVADQNSERALLAERYDEACKHLRPVAARDGRVPHLYVVRPDDREAFRAHMQAREVSTGVHYPRALPDHAYLRQSGVVTDCPVAREACQRVVSLPCQPGLSTDDQVRVLAACLSYGRQAKAQEG